MKEITIVNFMLDEISLPLLQSPTFFCLRQISVLILQDLKETTELHV